MLSKKKNLEELKGHEKCLNTVFATKYIEEEIPKYELPEEMMPADVAYTLVKEEMNMDNNPSKNLATFVTTYMEPLAEKLLKENLNKNFIDHPEYPQTEVVHERCVNIISRLFNAPHGEDAIGTATVGSSEAIMLGLLAHKWNWKNRKIREGKPYDKPNIVFGADVHVCWDKFAKYFDVESRIIPLTSDRFVIDASSVEKVIDENTICVGCVLGTTFTGQSDPVKEINDLLVRVKEERGLDIPIHVDAASGGFVLPFTDPDYKWDFRLEQVKSINVSGHKYGLVYAGLGWLIFRNSDSLPPELIFNVDYLGKTQSTYTLNFSRSSAQIYGQYYNFLRFGRKGYTSIMKNTLETARYLSSKLEGTGYFSILSVADLLPIVALKFKQGLNFNEYDLADELRKRGWVIPAYRLPPNAEDISLFRVVVKPNFSREMADILTQDIKNAIDRLSKKDSMKIPTSNRKTTYMT